MMKTQSQRTHNIVMRRMTLFFKALSTTMTFCILVVLVFLARDCGSFTSISSSSVRSPPRSKRRPLSLLSPFVDRHNSHHHHGSDGVFDRPPASTSFWKLRSTASPSRRSSDASSSSSSSRTRVIYQKVVHASSSTVKSNVDNTLFLGMLVEYLQDEFELPNHVLPMAYEKELHFANDNDDDTDNNSYNSGVVTWNSPLSPNPTATALHVQVVAIYPENDSDNNDKKDKPYSATASNMAMVVVSKQQEDNNSKSSALPPMMKNLFDDSEKKIVKALERGLQDFVSGSTKTTSRQQKSSQSKKQQSSPKQRQQQQQSPEEAREALLSELVDEEEHDENLLDKLNHGQKQQEPSTSAQSQPIRTTKIPKKNGVLDAEIVVDTTKTNPAVDTTTASSAADIAKKEQPKQEEPSKAKPNKKRNTPRNVYEPSSSSSGTDFAVVEAAKRAAAAASKTTTQQSPSKVVAVKADFAVEAARQAAAALRKQQERVDSKKKMSPAAATPVSTTTAKRQVPQHVKSEIRPAAASSSSTNSNIQEMSPTQIAQQRPPCLDNPSSDGGSGRGRAVWQTISRPQDYQKRRQEREKKNQQQVSSSSSSSSLKQESNSAALTPPLTDKAGGKKIANNVQEAASTPEPSRSSKDEAVLEPPKSKPKQKKKANTTTGTANETSRVKDENDNMLLDPMDNDERVRLSEEAMNEITDTIGSDLTPEQLLESVMTFGKAEDEKNAIGAGFVSGALEKAKDVLQMQQEQQQRKRKEQAGGKAFKEMGTPSPDLAPDIAPVDSDDVKQKLSAEEELRELFQAGERLADGRITRTEASSLKTKSSSSTESKMAFKTSTEKDVDDLIAKGDRDVSSYARVLDDELAELEIRLNKAPGEEDTYFKNGRPNFDVFSGPEVYNPNVDDPETAVNWPGAKPGTRNDQKNGRRLPDELEEAVKQANFAAHVLANLKEESDGSAGTAKKYRAGDRELTQEQVDGLQTVAKEAIELGLIENPLVLEAERSRLQLILDELWDQPRERYRDIASNYKDLLLSDNFVPLIQERLTQMANRDLDALRRKETDDDINESDTLMQENHKKERDVLGELVQYAQLLLKEARALGAEMEAQQLEVIRSICKVAMDPAHQTEEETAMALTDAVRDMRPLFDDAFVAYLKYAVAEEEARLARAGVLDDPAHNHWLFVLQIVQQGVYAEIARGINRYIEHIWYVLRMETPTERRMLLEKLIDAMPTLDVRPFVGVVENMVGALGDSARGEFDGVTALGEMTNKLLQLHRDVKELLPPERIALMSRDADEWAAARREKLRQQRKETKQRLEAQRQTEHLDGEIESLVRRGEMERIE